MPYKVSKLIEDSRNNTCGFFLPNGGFYHVVEMRFENHKQLTDIGNKSGYSVDFVSGECGFFDRDGFAIDPATLEVHPATKKVIEYAKVTEVVRGKEKVKKSAHEDLERAAVIEEAQAMGLKTKWQSTQALKNRIAELRRAPQASLAR